MYHAYFGLREEPFGVTPDCRFLFQSEQHDEATATLYYAIQQRRGFAALVGGAGLGKTSVLVYLMQRLEHKATIAYLPHPYFDHTTVLEAILLSLGLVAEESAAKNHRLFYDFLIEARRAGKTCVVLFDEAQNMNRATLEAIRMLSNFEMQTEKLVQIVLAGQPCLAETLKRPDCEQIRQRCSVIARLKPLSRSELYDCMNHRLKMAGGSIEVFSREARDLIVSASGGVMRTLNTICFNSLSLAYAQGHPQVTRQDVGEVVRDLDLSLDDAVLAPVLGQERDNAAEAGREPVPSMDDANLSPFPKVALEDAARVRISLDTDGAIAPPALVAEIEQVAKTKDGPVPTAGDAILSPALNGEIKEAEAKPKLTPMVRDAAWSHASCCEFTPTFAELDYSFRNAWFVFGLTVLMAGVLLIRIS